MKSPARNGNWSALEKLVPDELAGWWQLTLEFMTIVSKQWPQYLQDNNKSDPAAYRQAIIQAETEDCNAKGPKARLLQRVRQGPYRQPPQLLHVISTLDQGAVVLPGLDKDMDAEAWDSLVDDDKALSIFGHPQFGLKKLLAQFGITREDVAQIGAITADLHARNALISNSLMPAPNHLQME